MDNELKEAIENAIDYEKSKDLSGQWTPDYREGYVDGLRRSLEIAIEVRNG